MDAIISDIHGNLEALNAVLLSAQSWAVTRIVCLGDIVGYGPNPVECAERLLACDVFVSGDWDVAAVAANPPKWSEHLLSHLNWVKSRLGNAEQSSRLRQVFSVPTPCRVEGDKTYFHGTPRDRSEWLFPEDIYLKSKMEQIASDSLRYGFCGHNHIAGIYSRSSEDAWEFRSDGELGDGWHVLEDSSICSVGSVGQPRDGDPRAAFVLCDGNQVRFVRVPYDLDSTMCKIKAIPEIDRLHADRLRKGR